ncbi:MAG TPA: response regulator transcription factor [Ottowia sp.]|uniref:response regulator transcription factor n=1 Tax=Ottowia sp. TaxID=1898956 RepID=UPI002CB7C9EE|nr:response regulator transcription factor [Ottowia sp.]HMN22355.1 response regulator transcription factor [Ottowia sp.]
MAAWRVLIVEDDAPMRAFFADSVRAHGELELAGNVGTRAEACAWIDACRGPLDVLLVDLGLPDGSGLDVIRHARGVHPECEPLVISMFGDEDSVLASIEAGALGYIHKDSTPESIAATIVEMKDGASPISPMIARRVLAKYLDLRRRPSAAGVPAPLPASEQVLLSQREREVLERIARGFSYAEVARLLGLSVHTVQSHMKSLYAKLAVHSRSEAVFEASRMGLLPPLGRGP